MPEGKFVIGAALAAAGLVLVVGGLSLVATGFLWIVEHPLIIVAVVGLFVALGVYRARRNRV